MLRSLLLFALTASVSSTAWAQDKPSQANPPSSPCIDDAKRLGVQEKTFLRRHRLELVAEGGFYASDLLSTSWAAGGAADFWIFEDFAVHTSLDVTPVALDIDASLSQFLGQPPVFKEGKGLLLLGGFTWSPIHFKVKTAGGGIKHGDFSFDLDAGRLFNPTTQGLAFAGGAAMELYLTRWLSLKLDVRDVMLIQEAVDETRLTNNVTALLGLGIWVPFGF